MTAIEMSDGPAQYHYAVVDGSQPEGLSDSSRWSERSADHRPTNKDDFHPEKGGRKRWHPSRVRANCSPRSGGLRYAPTTGYYLTAFQAEILRRNCRVAVSLCELKSI